MKKTISIQHLIPSNKAIFTKSENSENQRFEITNSMVYRIFYDILIFSCPIRNHVDNNSHDDMGHVGIKRTLLLIKSI